VRFWFSPVDPLGLHIVRVLTGLLCLAWLLPFAGHVEELFGLRGWFDHQAFADLTELMQGRSVANWSVLYLCGENASLLGAVYWISIVVVALFTLGLPPRITSILTWLAMASFTANPMIESDGDVYVLLLTFYLMIGYVLLGQRRQDVSLAFRILGPLPSWLSRWKDPEGGQLAPRVGAPVNSRSELTTAGGAVPPPSVGANVALRLLQVHFALAMLVSGLHKLQAGEWWSGVAFWYSLYPPLETTLTQAREHAPHAQFFLAVLSLGAYAVLAWQIGFPLFAWRSRWRPVLLGGGVAAWLGAAFLYELPLLGPATFVCCLAFVAPGEWRGWIDWIRKRLGRTEQASAAEVNMARATEKTGRVPVR
jgi:hypothetical protein